VAAGAEHLAFEQETVDEVISRLDKLQNTSPRQWGKMDVAQMMAQCSITLDIASGRLNPRRVFIGRLNRSVFEVPLH